MSELPYRDIPPELLEALLDNPHESQIVIDAQGIVRYISSSDEAFYKISRKDAIGRHISELNPDSELPRDSGDRTSGNRATLPIGDQAAHHCTYPAARSVREHRRRCGQAHVLGP